MDCGFAVAHGTVYSPLRVASHRACGSSRISSGRSGYDRLRPRGVAVFTSVAALLRRKGRSFRRASENSEGSDEAASEDSQRKLQTLLDATVRAEAEGEPENMLGQAEAAAKQFVIFAGNGFRNFGSGEQLEKRVYTDEEFKDANVDIDALLKVKDTKSGLVRGFGIFWAAAVVISIILLNGNLAFANTIGLAILVLAGTDQLLNGGSLSDLILDSVAGATNTDYQGRVVQHEAARFLAAYLLGVLPKSYTLSSAEALDKYQSTKISGSGCVFCQSDFLKSVRAGNVSSSDIDRFVCIGIAGVAQEWLIYGEAQTGGFNLQSIDSLYGALGWEKRRMADQTRWAALNVVNLLRCNKELQAELAQGMSRGSNSSSLMKIIERNLGESAS